MSIWIVNVLIPLIILQIKSTLCVLTYKNQVNRKLTSILQYNQYHSMIEFMAVTSSSDGTKLAAVTGIGELYPDGYIYTSTNAGQTWSQNTFFSARHWVAIASNSNGTMLVASTHTGSMFISYNSGLTWTQSTVYATTIALSDDGSKIACTRFNDYITTSSDAGSTWVVRTTSGARYWQSIASIADGTILAAVVSNGYIYISRNSGETWTGYTALGSQLWESITMSSNGMFMAAVTWNRGYLYTSNDSGLNFTVQPAAGMRSWETVSCSSDGTKLVASGLDSNLYSSIDSGVTWTTLELGIGKWRSVKLSSNGERLVAAKDNDVYSMILAEPPTPQPTNQPTLQPTMPTMQPTIEPSAQPTISPTAMPTHQPSLKPTFQPTLLPTTIQPSYVPTKMPSTTPTETPTLSPSASPTVIPSVEPTGVPTSQPTYIPSARPSTRLPTSVPTSQPVKNVTLSTSIPINNVDYSTAITPTGKKALSVAMANTLGLNDEQVMVTNIRNSTVSSRRILLSSILVSYLIIMEIPVSTNSTELSYFLSSLTTYLQSFPANLYYIAQQSGLTGFENANVIGTPVFQMIPSTPNTTPTTTTNKESAFSFNSPAGYGVIVAIVIIPIILLAVLIYMKYGRVHKNSSTTDPMRSNTMNMTTNKKENEGVSYDRYSNSVEANTVYHGQNPSPRSSSSQLSLLPTTTSNV